MYIVNLIVLVLVIIIMITVTVYWRCSNMRRRITRFSTSTLYQQANSETNQEDNQEDNLVINGFTVTMTKDRKMLGPSQKI